MSDGDENVEYVSEWPIQEMEKKDEKKRKEKEQTVCTEDKRRKMESDDGHNNSSDDDEENVPAKTALAIWHRKNERGKAASDRTRTRTTIAAIAKTDEAREFLRSRRKRMERLKNVDHGIVATYCDALGEYKAAEEHLITSLDNCRDGIQLI
jgi:hypothetical protein